MNTDRLLADIIDLLDSLLTNKNLPKRLEAAHWATILRISFGSLNPEAAERAKMRKRS